jgi:hypothetical protein
MNALSITLLAMAGLTASLETESIKPSGAVWDQAATSCSVAPSPPVPAEYFHYHAMVAPLSVVPGSATAQASCSPRKVIRT